MNRPEVLIVGGGMITQVQILPSIYHLQRQGIVGNISICALNSAPLKVLAEDESLKKAFPGQSFKALPSLDSKPEQNQPDLFEKAIAQLPENSIVAVAMPDQLHYMVIKGAIANNHHIMCVKPLVLKYDQAIEIEKQAYEKGLAIGIEYHKRLDDRALIARGQYKEGLFGEFKIGHAEMNEPYYYRNSNFQNWCTCENSDMFTYVGCHYIDQVHFITGLLPKSVSVYGIKDKYPNGKDGYLWTDGRIIWGNGACLHVTNIMGYPDDGPGGNFQGLRMYCAGKDKSGMLVHNDQYRGIEYCYAVKDERTSNKYYSEPSPDYFKYIDLGDGGQTPVGYGYRSIEFIIKNITKCLGQDLKQRQKLLKEFDKQGVMATPANSSYNELVMEAGRLSILNGGKEVEIVYGDNAGVKLKS
ncbi:MAG: Gfo/Idh/MocA family oxidoreductase [Phycisphaerae bacterium]|jgi:predicted dehydrogenase